MKCKIRITKEITGLFPQYQPKVGKIYDAEYIEPYYQYQNGHPICVIDIAGKRIIIRNGEYEFVRC